MGVVLATGTVANAEDVNFIKDPSNFINIVGISEFDTQGSSGFSGTWDTLMDTEGELITTSAYSTYTTPFFTRTTGFFHKMTIEIKKEDGQGVLDQAAICFFDSNILTNASERESTCGNGIDAQGAGLGFDQITNFIGTRTGQSKPQSAIQIGFIPSITPNSSSSSPIMNIDPNIGTAGNPNHNIRPAFTSGTNISKVSLTDQFNGVAGAAGSVYKLEILFVPSQMAKNTAGWKIRVLPKYLNSTDGTITQHELISTQSYTVRYSSALITNTRNQVDYGSATPSGAAESRNISTAVFQANNNVDITLKPSKFSSDGVSVDFGTASNQIRMACGPDQNNLQDFIGDAANKLFANIEGNSEPGVNAREYKAAPSHDCTLFIGSDIAPSSYSNTMTMAVGPAVN